MRIVSLLSSVCATDQVMVVPSSPPSSDLDREAASFRPSSLVSSVLDGVEVAAWWPGVKIPGITVTVPVHGRSVCLVGLTGDFDIDLTRSPGIASLAPALPLDYSPSARVRAQRAVMWVVLGLCGGLPLVAGGVAVLLWALGLGR